MVELKAISYEESRMEYFRKQRDSAKRRMNYWCGAKQADRVGWMEASDRASEASAQYNFYKDALEALAAHPKWISVEDRLPEPNTTVLLIAHGWKHQLVYIGKLEKVESVKSWLTGLVSKASEWTVYGFSYLKEPIVTHWMPLPSMPEPPKDDCNEQ